MHTIRGLLIALVSVLALAALMPSHGGSQGIIGNFTANKVQSGTKPTSCSPGPPADVWVDTGATPYTINVCGSGGTFLPIVTLPTTCASNALLVGQGNGVPPLCTLTPSGLTSLTAATLTASTSVNQSGANGQLVTIQALTEVTTILAAATTATAIQIPANAVVLGVDTRVTTVIPTAATFTVTGTSSSTVFNTVAISTAGGTTDPGTKSCPFYNATAQTLTYTPNAQPGAATGQVRITIHYYTVTPATS